MADLSIKEIEELTTIIHHAAKRGESGDGYARLGNMVAFKAASALRQLLEERRWRPIDDEAKQGVVLIKDNDRFAKAAIWDEAGDAEYPWKFFDDDGTINRVMARYVTGYRPLPSPETEGE